MKTKIVHELKNIETEYGVKILLACESGSRAWGFPSQDSDYDVRFIYLQPRDWYLTIDEKRDVIELPIDEVLDISGWDLRKSLRLMRKSNSPLLEWISSPIQYLVDQSAYDDLLSLSKQAFLPETSCWHYLSMAKKSVQKLEDCEQVKLKTYMYILRPLLCCQWIIKHSTQPPMQIGDLLRDLSGEEKFKLSVVELIEEKKKHLEKDRVPRLENMETVIRKKLEKIGEQIPKNHQGPDVQMFDEFFRKTMR